MAAVLLIVGALLVVAGVAMLSIPAAFITAGIASVAASYDLVRRAPAPTPTVPE